jgi:Ti-type conjugative transfer relaxase TraA
LLHTHVLVANLIQGVDGKWGALDARHLYVQAKTAGYLYQAHLRAELTRRLGVEWTPVRNGTADIEGVPRDAIRAFSTRRAEIELQSERHGDSARAAQVAALATRKAKDYSFSPESLLPEWRARAQALGVDEEHLESLLERSSYRSPTWAETQELEADLLSPRGLTAQDSTFTRREVLQGICVRLQSGADVADIEERGEALIASDEVISLGAARADWERTAARRDERFTTAEILATEQALIERATDPAWADAGVAPAAVVEHVLERRPSLFDDQKDMVRVLTMSGNGIDLVVGKAGTGKTFALDAAREAWEQAGYRVVGCSLSARAAQELQAGSGIPSSTLTSVLRDLDDSLQGGLTAQTVVVVDEAAMVGTRDLDRLVGHAERAKAKVVLVGDDRQLPEIAAGGAFRGIKNRLAPVELGEVRRQPFGWERQALELVRNGRAREAIGAYGERDRIVVAPSSDATRDRLVADWWETGADPEPGIMLAARRSDVADLNRRARNLMTEAGLLGDESLEVADQRFAKGDRVMTLKKDKRLGVVNGTRGVVTDIDSARLQMTIACEDGSAFVLTKSYLQAGHLTHAYAMTGHKAQGMTAQKAFVLGDETLYREWAYVAMSRGKQENHLYVVAGIDAEREELGGQVAGVDDPLEEVTRALGRSRGKELAIDTGDLSLREEPSSPPKEARVLERSIEP